MNEGEEVMEDLKRRLNLCRKKPWGELWSRCGRYLIFRRHQQQRNQYKQIDQFAFATLDLVWMIDKLGLDGLEE